MPVVWIVWALLAGAAAAQDGSLDAIVRAEMERQHIPGIALGVFRNGQVLRAGGYGLANVELSVPATAQSVWKIGSVSKQFVAAGILLLEQDGKLAVDDAVHKHLEDAPDSWRGITLKHLMSHSGGLVRESPAFAPFRIQPDADVIRAAYTTPLQFPVGAKYQYSNLGYFMLAEIIRRVSGQPWEEFLAQRIFRPVGMTDTRTTTATELVPRRADSYEWRKDRYVRAPDFLALRPSGALLSTVLDMAKWDAALATDFPLQAAAREKMWSAVIPVDPNASYGLGWRVHVWKGRRAVSHGGSLGGFKSCYGRLRDDGWSFVAFANQAGADACEVLFKVAETFARDILVAP